MHRLIVVEALENRIAPAGVITGTFNGGILTLNGDALDNDVALAPDLATSSFTISSTENTVFKINGETNTEFTLDDPLLQVIANLGEGSDTISLRGFDSLNSLVLNMGGGSENTATLEDISASGAITYTGGSGDDLLILEGSSIRAGSLKMMAGNGDNELRVSARLVEVDGALSFTGGTGADGIIWVNQTWTYSQAAVRGGVTVDLGGGWNFAGIRVGELEVNGSLKITGGVGHDEVALEANTTTIGGGMNVNLGMVQTAPTMANFDTPEVQQGDLATLSLGTTSIDGAIKVTMGNDPSWAPPHWDEAPMDPRELQPTVIDIGSGKVAGGISIQTGNGDHHLALICHGDVNLGPVTVKTGAASDAFIMKADTATIGKLSVDLGNGDNGFAFFRNETDEAGTELDPNTNSVKVASLSYTGGADADYAIVSLPRLNVPGAITLTSGGGYDNALAVEAYYELSAQSITLTGGEGKDQLTVGNEDASARFVVPSGIQVTAGGGGDWYNSVRIYTGDYSGGAIRVTGGMGDDEIILSMATAAISGPVQINPGNGSNFVGIASLDLDASEFSVNGGMDVDEVSIKVESLTASGAVKIAAGGGSNTIGLAGATLDAASFTLSGGAQVDTAEIAYGDINLHGALQLLMGAGVNEGLLTASHALVASKLAFVGGPNDDSLQLEAGTLDTTGAVTVDLGNGVNTLYATTGLLDVGGGVTITGAAGTDSISLTSTRLVSGAFTINTGNGADEINVSVESAADIRGKLSLTTGNHAGFHASTSFSASDLRVLGGVSGAFGDGENQVILNTAGSFICKGPMTLAFTGNGFDSARISAATLISAGQVKFTADNGGSELMITNPDGKTELAGLNYLGAGGNDLLRLQTSTGAIHGALSMSMGSGNNSGEISSLGQMVVEGDIHYNSSSENLGQDSFQMVNVINPGKLSIEMGDAASELLLGGCNLSSLSANLGGGNDLLRIQSGASRVMQQVHGIASIIGGRGNDTFEVDSGLAFKGAVIYDGGEGEDTLVDDESTYWADLPRLVSVSRVVPPA